MRLKVVLVLGKKTVGDGGSLKIVIPVKGNARLRDTFSRLSMRPV